MCILLYIFCLQNTHKQKAKKTKEEIRNTKETKKKKKKNRKEKENVVAVNRDCGKSNGIRYRLQMCLAYF